MNKLQVTLGVSVLPLLLAGCGPKPQAQQQAAPVAQSFQKPLVSAHPVDPKAITQTVTVKGLLPSTNSQVRLSTISPNGKRDPFAAVVPLPGSLTALVTKTPQVTPPSQPKSAVPLAPIARNPAGTGIRLTPQSWPAPVTPQVLPPLPVSNLPVLPVNQLPPAPLSVSPTSLAEAIEITGVVQTSGRLVAIIKAPDEQTARYVQVGESMSGGRVVLKQIVMSRQGEPRVILQENGVQVTKSIGA
jgi:hypothetical protein